MATLQEALSPFATTTSTSTPVSAKVKCTRPNWFLGEGGVIEVAPHLKKVYLYMEEEHNVSSGGRLSMMAGRRFKLSELPLGSINKSTRQCELAGECYCTDENGIRNSYMCSSGFYEESRWLVGIVIVPKGAQASAVWRLVPDEIVKDYDRRKRSSDLSRWVEDMPTN